MEAGFKKKKRKKNNCFGYLDNSQEFVRNIKKIYIFEAAKTGSYVVKGLKLCNTTPEQSSSKNLMGRVSCLETVLSCY